MAKRLADVEQFEVTSRQQWREWLAEHYLTKENVWLVTYKKHCGDKYVDYDATVEEALCFGWIDSLPRRLDDDRTMLYFCRRKKGSPWSRLNKTRLEKLIPAGLLTAHALQQIEAAKADGSWTVYDSVEAGIVPEDLAVALAANPTAEANYNSFSLSVRKGLLWWIKTAKRDATRQTRIAKTVAAAAEGKVANQ